LGWYFLRVTHFPKIDPHADNHARYKLKNGELSNRILLAALLDVWGNRCYINGCVKDFYDYEIEHIIPHTISKDELKRVLEKYGSEKVQALTFDVHSPHNLAPACKKCNRGKGNKDFSASGYLMEILDKACTWEPKVVKRVERFRSSNTVAESILAMTIADLSDSASKDALSEMGPLVVNRLRMVAPEVLEAPSSYDFDAYDGSWSDDSHQVFVMVDEDTRRARVVLEDFYGGDFDGVLRLAVAAVKRAIVKRLRQEIVGRIERDGHVAADGSVPSARMVVEVSGVKFDSELDGFNVWGNFRADGSAVVDVMSGYSDSGTESLQGDEDMEGDFVAPVYVDRSENPAEAEAGDVELSVVEGSFVASFDPYEPDDPDDDEIEVEVVLEDVVWVDGE
jgi:hypothetical protein